MALPVRATYRLQLTPDFTFAEAEALVPYFARLGVSHLYLSPITEAVPGSTHGYDATDLTAVRSELGGRDGFESLRAAAVQAGLGLLLDFVPNHAGAHAANERWQRTLAHGPHAEPQFFDIDWASEGGSENGKVLLPFLGDSYGDALDGGEITLVCEGGRLFAAYYEHRFALRPDRYADALEEALPHTHGTLLGEYRALAPGDDAEDLRPRLKELAEREDLNAHLQNLQGPALHDLLEDQHWRLTHWRTAQADLNYRRFFQINDLVALRQEDDAVFEDTHRLLAELTAEKGVDGVRIDHVDGLADPQGYLEKLRDDLGIAHVWVEKILAEGETLPAAWPVEGTSGYAFMNDAMHVLTDPAGEAPLTETYETLVPSAAPFAEEVRAGKSDAMDTTLAADRRRLARGLKALADRDYHTRDLPQPVLDDVLTAVTAAFDRYRTYLPRGKEQAAAVLDDAIAEAQQYAPFPDRAPYAFLKSVVLGDVDDALREDALAWTRRFQQFTAPVAAKGVEDAAFYRYNRLAAHAEVGGEPDHFGLSKAAFHRRCRFRTEYCPQTLLATATHDHKRGEETRARLIALAERPDDWHGVAGELADIGRRHAGDYGPHPADAYLFYQILAALWPEREGDDFVERLTDYMEKAVREAKRETRWIDADADYEADVEAFVRGVAGDPATADALRALPQHLAADGFFTGLSQLLLKTLTPGVPDFYQGRELPDTSLVDPDNRRPVDYDRRRALLDELLDEGDARPTADTVRQWTQEQDEHAKLFFTACLLRLRQQHPPLFAEGSHTPLDVEPPEDDSGDADVWIAFARRHEKQTLVAAVPRFPRRWRVNHDAALTLPSTLAGQSLTEVLSGQTVEPDAGGTLALDALPLPWAVLMPA